MKTTKERKHVT